MRTSRSLLLTLLLGALVCVASTASAANSSPDACRVGTKRAVIGGKVKCLRAGQVCQARYQTAYKRYGFTCVKGHLRKRTAPPTPQPPAPPAPVPPTPPPPPAQAGHYHGTTSQLEVIDFDVTSSGRTVTNVSTVHTTGEPQRWELQVAGWCPDSDFGRRHVHDRLRLQRNRRRQPVNGPFHLDRPLHGSNRHRNARRQNELHVQRRRLLVRFRPANLDCLAYRLIPPSQLPRLDSNQQPSG